MTMKSKPISVLLVDDSPAMLWGLSKLIRGESPRMALIGSVHTAEEALVYGYLHPNVIVLDIELDGGSSIELIPALSRSSGGHVVMHTGLGDSRLHEDAILFGARGVVSKGAPAEQVLQAIEHVHSGRFWDVVPCDAAPSARHDMPRGSLAGLGIDLLSPAERSLITDVVERWHDPLPAASKTPVMLGPLISIYNKLGLRNRMDLARFAMEHGLS